MTTPRAELVQVAPASGTSAGRTVVLLPRGSLGLELAQRLQHATHAVVSEHNDAALANGLHGNPVHAFAQLLRPCPYPPAGLPDDIELADGTIVMQFPAVRYAERGELAATGGGFLQAAAALYGAVRTHHAVLSGWRAVPRGLDDVVVVASPNAVRHEYLTSLAGVAGARFDPGVAKRAMLPGPWPVHRFCLLPAATSVRAAEGEDYEAADCHALAAALGALAPYGGLSADEKRVVAVLADRRGTQQQRDARLLGMYAFARAWRSLPWAEWPRLPADNLRWALPLAGHSVVRLLQAAPDEEESGDPVAEESRALSELLRPTVCLALAMHLRSPAGSATTALASARRAPRFPRPRPRPRRWHTPPPQPSPPRADEEVVADVRSSRSASSSFGRAIREAGARGVPSPEPEARGAVGARGRRRPWPAALAEVAGRVLGAPKRRPHTGGRPRVHDVDPSGARTRAAAADRLGDDPRALADPAFALAPAAALFASAVLRPVGRVPSGPLADSFGELDAGWYLCHYALAELPPGAAGAPARGPEEEARLRRRWPSVPPASASDEARPRPPAARSPSAARSPPRPVRAEEEAPQPVGLGEDYDYHVPLHEEDWVMGRSGLGLPDYASATRLRCAVPQTEEGAPTFAADATQDARATAPFAALGAPDEPDARPSAAQFRALELDEPESLEPAVLVQIVDHRPARMWLPDQRLTDELRGRFMRKEAEKRRTRDNVRVQALGCLFSVTYDVPDHAPEGERAAACVRVLAPVNAALAPREVVPLAYDGRGDDAYRTASQVLRASVSAARLGEGWGAFGGPADAAYAYLAAVLETINSHCNAALPSLRTTLRRLRPDKGPWLGYAVAGGEPLNVPDARTLRPAARDAAPGPDQQMRVWRAAALVLAQVALALSANRRALPDFAAVALEEGEWQRAVLRPLSTPSRRRDREPLAHEFEPALAPASGPTLELVLLEHGLLVPHDWFEETETPPPEADIFLWARSAWNMATAPRGRQVFAAGKLFRPNGALGQRTRKVLREARRALRRAEADTGGAWGFVEHPGRPMSAFPAKGPAETDASTPWLMGDVASDDDDSGASDIPPPPPHGSSSSGSPRRAW